MKTYIITKHAQEEIAIRGIPESILDAVMQTPVEVVPEKAELVAYHSVIRFPEGPVLVSAIVAGQVQPMRIITVYRTSKIEKYWRGS